MAPETSPEICGNAVGPLARCPDIVPEVVSPAVTRVQGRTRASEALPAPPNAAVELPAMFDAFTAVTIATSAIEASSRDLAMARNQSLEDMADLIRLDLKYAELAAFRPGVVRDTRIK